MRMRRWTSTWTMMWSSGVSLLALVVGADIHGDLDVGM